MTKRKRRVWRAYGPTPEFKWTPNFGHEHQLEEVQERTGNQIIILDKCTLDGCEYQQARDLITTKEPPHDANGTS